MRALADWRFLSKPLQVAKDMTMNRQFGTIAVVMGLWAGPLFGQDVDCQNAMTQVDLTQCASQDFDAADAVLNDAYQAAIARMAAIDADLSADQQGAEAALREAQRAWITVRDNTCLAESYTWFGGSGQGMVELTCLARISRARTEDLNILSATF